MLVNGLMAMLERVAEIEQKIAALQPQKAAETSQSFATTLAEVQEAKPPPKPSPTDFDILIDATAARYDMDPDLIHAVVKAESGYDPDCTSGAGAQGLMQLMPGTARALGVSNSFDPVQNLDGGVRYLKQQLKRFGEIDLALAAYNAGPGAVKAHDGIPPYRETQTYVKRVLQTLWQRKGD